MATTMAARCLELESWVPSHASVQVAWTHITGWSTRFGEAGREYKVIEAAIDVLRVASWATRSDDRGIFRQSYQLGELAEALGRDVVL